MRIRKITANGDFTFGKGLQNYAINVKAVEQNITTRILSWQNDCFWAIGEGANYQFLFDKNQQANLSQAIKSIILGSYGVTAVNEVTAVLDDERNLSVKYTVETIFGSSFSSLVTM